MITEEVIGQRENFEIRRFIPQDSTYPNFYIKVRDGKSLENMKIVAIPDHWPTTSDLPFCHYKLTIGQAGDERTEGDVILLEHNVEYKHFSRAVLDCLPPQDEKWQIPADEIQKRLDLRAYPVCSIDPVGCKDIDDALHCRILPNGNWEAGVHIADVSYFVKADSAIDLEA